jgi:4-amino-4-deoxy-L-arabinose transferase-like glycosyltransferase
VTDGGAARTARRVICLACAVGVCLRLAFALGYWVDKPLTHDEREYLALAGNLAAGRGFTPDLPAEPREAEAERFGRPPLYPALLAPVVARDPDLRAGRMPAAVPVPIKIVQSVVAALFIGLIGATAWRSGGPPAGAWSAGIAAVYPPLVWISAYALTEVLYAVLALGAVWVLGTVTDRTPPPRLSRASAGIMVAAGVLTGLGALTRPATLFFFPLIALWLVWERRLALAVLFCAATLLIIAPWTARNLKEHGRPVLIASGGGVTFWTGNHPLAIGEGDLAANPQLKRANVELRRQHRGLSPEELEPIYYREAWAWIAANPLDWAWLLVRKAFYAVVPIGPSYTLHSPRYFWASILSYGAVLPFAVAGIVALRGRPWKPRALFALAISLFIVYLVFFPQERFRIPVIDPLLIVCAGIWAAWRRAGPPAWNAPPAAVG